MEYSTGNMNSFVFKLRLDGGSTVFKSNDKNCEVILKKDFLCNFGGSVISIKNNC